MKVIKPTVVTEAIYSASNIPEPDSSQGEVEWIPDRQASLILDKNSIGAGSKTIDAVCDGVNIFALESFGYIGWAYTSERAYIHKYTKSGVYSGVSFWVDNFLSAIEIVDGDFYCTSVGGFVRKRDSSGALVDTFDVTSIAQNPVGICHDGTRFYLLDRASAKVIGVDSSFVADGFEFDITVNNLSLYGLRHKDGIFYSTDQISGEILKLNTAGQDVGKIKINNPTNVVDFGGVFFIDSDLYSINSDDNKAYKYVNEIYDGFYKKEERVIKLSTHKVYECAIATDLDPETAINNVPPEWVKVKTTNKFALVDTKVFSPSISATPITISLTPGEVVDSVAGFELVNVTTVDISAVSAVSGSVYNNTITLNADPLFPEGYPEFVDMDIPPFDDLTITVTFQRH